MDISVVIPTFNRVSLLPRALNSVLKQTCPASEVIVVDDGSSDGTEDLLRQDYPGVIYRYQSNQGVSAARNCGIQTARSEWIAFLDSDDEWVPAKLEKQQHALCDSGCRISHTNEIWIRNGVRVNQMNKHAKTGGMIYQHCLPLCAISPSSALIHRSVFESLGLFDEDLPACEDYDMWLRICSRYNVVLSDEPLLTKFGGHADQLSRTHWGMDRFRVRSLEKILLEGDLGQADRAATLEVLVEKLKILRTGAARRGNTMLLADCEEKLTFWSSSYAD